MGSNLLLEKYHQIFNKQLKILEIVDCTIEQFSIASKHVWGKFSFVIGGAAS